MFNIIIWNVFRKIIIIIIIIAILNLSIVYIFNPNE